MQREGGGCMYYGAIVMSLALVLLMYLSKTGLSSACCGAYLLPAEDSIAPRACGGIGSGCIYMSCSIMDAILIGINKEGKHTYKNI